MIFQSYWIIIAKIVKICIEKVGHFIAVKKTILLNSSIIHPQGSIKQ